MSRKKLLLKRRRHPESNRQVESKGARAPKEGGDGFLGRAHFAADQLRDGDGQKVEPRLERERAHEQLPVSHVAAPSGPVPF